MALDGMAVGSSGLSEMSRLGLDEVNEGPMLRQVNAQSEGIR